MKKVSGKKGKDKKERGHKPGPFGKNCTKIEKINKRRKKNNKPSFKIFGNLFDKRK